MSTSPSHLMSPPSDVVIQAAKKQLRFTDERFIWRFSPNQTDPELLEAIFVGRESLLQNVLEKITDSATSGATHHVLLWGPRGIGKSHFLSLLLHRLNSDEKLRDTIRIARLNEDETTTSVVQFLVRIYRALGKAYPDEFSLDWLDELLNQPPHEVADMLTRRLAARFEKRRLVILVENLNLLFESLGSEGQHHLRTLLQEQPFACLIASSQQLFKAVTDRSEPFFGFFQQIPLRPLSLQDAHRLLLKIATAKGQEDLVAFLNTADGRGRVRAIHDLAGGNHRVYIVLSGFVTRESLDQLVAPFQKMADDLTPYYQERLRWISPLQRQIVELLCREHRTLNPKEIARRLLLTEQSIGKQVRNLVEIGYLTSNKKGRETYYELSEPLMRLTYEVKENSLLTLLVEFLRIWYRPDQMLHLRMSGLCRSTQAYVDAAWERSQTQPDPRLKLLQDELNRAEAEGRSHELATLWEEIAAASNAADDWFQAGYYFDAVNKDYAQAIVCFDNVLEVNPNDADAWNNKGVSLFQLGKYLDSLSCYDRALKIDPVYAEVWNNKGSSLAHLGQDKEALSCFTNAVELDPRNASAWYNRGGILRALSRYKESLTCYDKALDLDPQNTCGRFNRGKVMFALHRWDDGFDALRDAFTHGSDPSCLGDVASMFGLIFQLSEDIDRLQSRINTLFTLYERAAEDRGFCSGYAQASEGLVNPLSHLADGLVKSLAKIAADRVTPAVLEGYVTAVEQCAASRPEFEIALRLFRYGIRYFITRNEADFVELIQPERNILRQTLGLASDGN